MARLNDAAIVACYVDCEQAAKRKGLTVRTNKTNFIARDYRNVKVVEAHTVTEFRRSIRAWRKPKEAEILLFQSAHQKRIAEHMRTHQDARVPYSLVDNEDLQGRIPGDKGYRGPGR